MGKKINDVTTVLTEKVIINLQTIWIIWGLLLRTLGNIFSFGKLLILQNVFQTLPCYGDSRISWFTYYILKQSEFCSHQTDILSNGDLNAKLQVSNIFKHKMMHACETKQFKSKATS